MLLQTNVQLAQTLSGNLHQHKNFVIFAQEQFVLNVLQISFAAHIISVLTQDNYQMLTEQFASLVMFQTV